MNFSVPSSSITSSGDNAWLQQIAQRDVVLNHVVFDCDGVLIDTETVAMRVLESMLVPRLAALSGVTENQANTAALHHALTDRVGMLTDQLLQEIDALFGFGFDVAQRHAINREVELHCGRESTQIPHVAQAVEQLAQRGIRLAVASNSSRPRIAASVERAGLTAFFGEQLYSGHDCHLPKPAPDVYLAAAAGLGVDPRSCLAVDDSLSGVTSSQAAGMVVLGYTGASAHPDKMDTVLRRAGAVHVFNDMRELPGLVAAAMSVQSA